MGKTGRGERDRVSNFYRLLDDDTQSATERLLRSARMGMGHLHDRGPHQRDRQSDAEHAAYSSRSYDVQPSHWIPFLISRTSTECLGCVR